MKVLRLNVNCHPKCAHQQITLCRQNGPHLVCYSFELRHTSTNKPMLTIFGRNFTEKVIY